ncbi:MAG: ABC transporter substrate-binding protein [Clostridia bacterium]|nr:ABC transporter substrate-binding protein [Clostridia bacterium]
MKNFKKITALMLLLVMCVAMFAACGGKDKDKTLVVGYAPFNSKFSPFFSETAYDQDVAAMTSLGLLTSDRTGAIVYKGKTGETIKYNGTDYKYYGPADLTVTVDDVTGKVYYDFELREDLKFSDGVALTVDDVIFSMYVLSDPTYDGSSTFFALPIEGMAEYRGTPIWQRILNDGEEDSAEGTEYYTAIMAETFWNAFYAAGAEFTQEIFDYCKDYGATTVAEAAALWGFGGLAADATTADFFAAIVAKYGYDISDNGINYESAGSAFKTLLLGKLDASYLDAGVTAPNISGIQKINDYKLRVVLTEVDATAIYQLGITIAPAHYYGNSEVDVENNKFGFTKGDLSSVRAKTTVPMGAGPYKFVKFENGVVYFEANNNYFLGAPKTKYVNFVECLSDDDKLNGILAGNIDISDPSFDKETVAQIKEANGGSLNGSKVNINTVNNLGYGYLGMSANALNIAGDPDSDASKNLRRAFATIFSVYRDVSVDTYYGEQASVINYPISDTSWAAPRPTDAGYEIAFSKDVNGNPIYTSTMTTAEKYAAAKTAALGFLEAAGYTVSNGKITAAPAGAPASFELWIPADGKGDHPSFMMASMGVTALKELGVDIEVKDLSDSSLLWDAIDAGTCQMWTAAWGATVDPDMYQIYYSGVAGGLEAGGSNYMYDIADAELDELILAARKTLDQSARKIMYKECLDIVIDWAVEVPVYQRQNAIAFGSNVDMSTVTPDITTFYGWMAEIQNLEMK